MEQDNVAFVTMLYEHNGERKIFKCGFEYEFISAFQDVNPREIEIGYFFVMGQEYGKVKTLENAFQFWKD